MLAQVLSLGSVAATGGTATAIYALNKVGQRSVGFKVAANWANASSAGISSAISFSIDNGATYNASAQVVPLLTASATGEVEVGFTYHLADSPFRVDAGSITHVKVVATNNDTSHAASVAVLAEDERHLGY
jgi:hypothetical protein